MKYWQIQKKAISESIIMHRPVKCYILDLIKYLLTASIILVGYGMFLYMFSKMQPLFDVIDQIKNYSTDIPAELTTQFLASKGLFMQFLISTIIIVSVAIILSILIIALFDSLILSAMKNLKYSWHRFIQYIKIYSSITLVFLLIAIMFFTIIADPVLFYIIYMIFMILYIYMLLVYQLVIDDKKKFLENIIRGFRAFARFKYTVILIIAAIIACVIVLLLSMLSALLLKQYMLIFAFLISALLSLWVRNYFYRMFLLLKSV
jgi:hypothetical protein